MFHLLDPTLQRFFALVGRAAAVRGARQRVLIRRYASEDEEPVLDEAEEIPTEGELPVAAAPSGRVTTGRLRLRSAPNPVAPVPVSGLAPPPEVAPLVNPGARTPGELAPAGGMPPWVTPLRELAPLASPVGPVPQEGEPPRSLSPALGTPALAAPVPVGAAQPAGSVPKPEALAPGGAGSGTSSAAASQARALPPPSVPPAELGAPTPQGSPAPTQPELEVGSRDGADPSPVPPVSPELRLGELALVTAARRLRFQAELVHAGVALPAPFAPQSLDMAGLPAVPSLAAAQLPATLPAPAVAGALPPPAVPVAPPGVTLAATPAAAAGIAGITGVGIGIPGEARPAGGAPSGLTAATVPGSPAAELLPNPTAAADDEFLFDQRLRRALARILQAEALRCGLDLGGSGT